MAPMPVTLVTGTSTGIGFATALHLAKHGHTVVATMRNLAKAGPLEAAAREQGVRLAVRELDVTDQASIDRAMAETRAREGAVDVLVNNAGIGGATPLELTPEAEHRAMFEANYWGPIRMIQAVLPSMRERRSGCIVILRLPHELIRVDAVRLHGRPSEFVVRPSASRTYSVS